MVQGFVTMATGDEKYYKMASNLLKSYKYFTSKPYKFAIIADRENEYTKDFDDVVIIDNPYKNYMDKIRLLDICPYGENIFIDADCLAYDDLNCYWDAFKDADDFSVFGKALPLDSQEGMFTKEGVAELKDKIHFCTHLHGVIYFIRPGKLCEDLLKTSYEIIESYSNYTVPYFDNPTDESVFAIAMSLMDIKPTNRLANYYVFYPVAEYVKTDISRGHLEYKVKGDSIVTDGLMVHWANVNTKKALYKKETLQLDYLCKKKAMNKLFVKIKFIYWKFIDLTIQVKKDFNYLIYKSKSLVYKILNKG